MEAINDLMAGMGILAAGVGASFLLTYMVNFVGRKFNNGEDIIDVHLF